MVEYRSRRQCAREVRPLREMEHLTRAPISMAPGVKEHSRAPNPWHLTRAPILKVPRAEEFPWAFISIAPRMLLSGLP